MNDLFGDKSKSYHKVKDILLKASVNIETISNELDSVNDLKDLKSVIDFLIREQLLYNLREHDFDKVKHYINMSIELLRKDLANNSLPFMLFSDVLNSLTIQSCEGFFAFMEDSVLGIKDTPIFGSGRTMLLRICNDLLRRLSKSQDTAFCGRIQIFLSRLFPLDEKSGLNLMGHFNTDALTPFCDDANEPDESVDLTEEVSIDLTDSAVAAALQGEDELKTDRRFYRRFWRLQDVFRSPGLCYEDSGWTEMVAGVEEVLSFFSRIRVSGQDHQRQHDDDAPVDWSAFSAADMTFTKYLTNEKLFDLQLMDVNFRRCIIMQLAVIFQYLLLPIKFKTADQKLSADRRRWVELKQQELQVLAISLSTEQEPFEAVLQLVLKREEAKSNWKNEGCPSFVRKRCLVRQAGDWDREREMSKKRITVDVSGRRVVSFGGNAELTRLWQAGNAEDNLAACRRGAAVAGTNRGGPEAVAARYSEVRAGLMATPQTGRAHAMLQDERWQWAALRDLSRTSQHFYFNWAVPGQTVAQYLASILTDKLSADLQKQEKRDSQKTVTETSQSQTKKDAGDAEDDEDNEEDEEDGGVEQQDEEMEDEQAKTDNNGSPDHQKENGEQLQKKLEQLVRDVETAARLIGPRWRQLAAVLKVNESEINEDDDAEEEDDNSARAKTGRLLRLWSEGGSAAVSADVDSFTVAMEAGPLEDVAKALREGTPEATEVSSSAAEVSQ